jgi:hypothetical protein
MSVIAMQIAVLVLAVVAPVAAHGQGKIEDHAGARRFVSEKYGFSIAVPPGWLVDPSGNTPLYFSFSPTDAGDFNHQLRLPKGGAVITVIAQDSLPPRQPRTLHGWAAADARGVSASDPSIRAFEMPTTTGVASAIISSYDSAAFGPDDQSEHRVNVFWEFRGKLFASHLMYPSHDSKGALFERVFVNTVRSIRPLSKAGSLPAQ